MDHWPELTRAEWVAEADRLLREHFLRIPAVREWVLERERERLERHQLAERLMRLRRYS